jgi:hypothetical protein
MRDELDEAGHLQRCIVPDEAGTVVNRSSIGSQADRVIGGPRSNACNGVPYSMEASFAKWSKRLLGTK